MPIIAQAVVAGVRVRWNTEGYCPGRGAPGSGGGAPELNISDLKKHFPDLGKLAEELDNEEHLEGPGFHESEKAKGDGWLSAGEILALKNPPINVVRNLGARRDYEKILGQAKTALRARNEAARVQHPSTVDTE